MFELEDSRLEGSTGGLALARGEKKGYELPLGSIASGWGEVEVGVSSGPGWSGVVLQGGWSSSAVSSISEIELLWSV